MPGFPVPLNVWADSQIALTQTLDHGPAPLPVTNSTASFWIDSPNANPLAKEGSEGPLTSDADVCIIGSGITGVSAAYHLANALGGYGLSARSEPLKVIILEARDFCSGATGRNGGHLAAHTFADFRRQAAAHGVDEALRGYAIEHYTVSEIVKLIEKHQLQDVVDLVEGGRVELLFSPQEVLNAKADFDAAGAAGADQYGCSYPGARIPSRNLWPLKFVTQVYKLAAASPHISLSLHTSTLVTSLHPATLSSARRWNLTTPRGDIGCNYVLHATNAYASHLLPHLSGSGGIIPVRGQVIATRVAVPSATLSRSAFTGNEGFEYWFPRPVNESAGEKYPLVIIGGGREASAPSYELYEADDSKLNGDVGAALRRFLPSVFPGRYEIGKEPEMEWSGIMGFTASNDPFVGPVIDASDHPAMNFRGQYISAGYSGHGMPRAYACGEAVAQMIVADITGKTWIVPEWLPRHYLTQTPVLDS